MSLKGSAFACAFFNLRTGSLPAHKMGKQRGKDPIVGGVGVLESLNW